MNILQKLAYQYGSILQAFETGRSGEKPKPEITRSKQYSPYMSAMAESARYSANYDQSIQEQSQRRAIQNSWAYTAIFMKAKEISGAADVEILDWSSPDEQDEPRKITRHPFMKVLRRPNSYMGKTFLWQYTSAWFDLSGEAFWFLIYNDQGELTELWPMPSNEMDLKPGDGEQLIEYYIYKTNGKEFHIDPNYICHLKTVNPFNIFRGLSPLIAAMMAIDMDLAMSMWNARLFTQDNVMPSAIINIKPPDPSQPIDPADIEQLKNDLRDEYSAWQRKTAIVTSGDISVEKLEWSPIEIDFRGGRDLSKQEIFQIYGIPPGMMDSGATLGNVRLADQIFKEKTLWPTLVMFAEQITIQIMQPNYGEETELMFKDVRPVNRQLELQEFSSATQVMEIDELRKTYFKLDPLTDNRGKRLVSESKQTPPTTPKTPDPGAPKNSIVGQTEGQPSLAEQGVPQAQPPKVQSVPKIETKSNGRK